MQDDLPVRRRLAVLADAARYDASCASSGSKRAAVKGGLGNADGMGICHSFTPDGRCVSLLKILLTNHCIYDCRYCVNRASSNVERASFTPEEVVTLTLEFYRRNYIEGLFLSSGVVKSPDETMARLGAVARQLREVHGFGGYIHLKAVAGASESAIALAGLFADRLSANIELPTESDLRALAPGKSVLEVETAMSQIRSRIEIAREERFPGETPSFAPAGQSTQLIVGATASTDATILATASRLYRTHRLKRVYYTAYSPIPFADPNLPARAPPLVREHRLYQADWLTRYYGFSVDELTTPDAPDLDLAIDPKTAWALRHRDSFPVDVNRAARESLLRVPGFGVKTVKAVLSARRHRAVTLVDLARLRVPLERARPFIVTADHNPSLALLDRVGLRARLAPPQQLALFGAAPPHTAA